MPCTVASSSATHQRTPSVFASYREDLRHDGTLRQQVQGHQPQRVQGGDLHWQVGQAHGWDAGHGLKQIGQGLQRLARPFHPEYRQLALLVGDQLQAALGHRPAVVIEWGGGFHDLTRVPRDTRHHTARHVAEVAGAEEHRVGRQHLPQRLAQIGNGREVKPFQGRRISRRRSGALSRRRRKFIE